jgi:GNAT superfamily N-acetyltransferase
MEIHRAVAADLDTLVPLFDGYREFYGQRSDPALARAFLDQRLARDDSVILLAREGGRALGFAQLYPLFSSVRCARLWLVNDLYVEPDARAGGVGRALLVAARRHAEATGACGLELATAHTNERAQRLYEGLGWTLDREFRRYELGLE